MVSVLSNAWPVEATLFSTGLKEEARRLLVTDKH